MTDKYNAVTSVIWELQATNSSPMWLVENPTYEKPRGRTFPVLKQLVLKLVDCMFFEPDLHEKWVRAVSLCTFFDTYCIEGLSLITVLVQSEEALNWAMHVPSLGMAQRCMHVTRALMPGLSPSLCHALLNALLQCNEKPSVTSFDFMAQVLVALVEILKASDPQQVKMYPQLFWGSLALLQSVHVPIFALVLEVMDALLSSVQLWNLPCQQILQAAAPSPGPDHKVPSGVLNLQPWLLGSFLFNNPRLCFVQQVLWKGLLHSSTTAATIRVVTRLLRQLAACLSSRSSNVGISTFQAGVKAMGASAAAATAHGLSQLLGQISYQLVACLVAGIPWVISNRHTRELQQDVRAYPCRHCM
jgi:hypothetical protein